MMKMQKRLTKLFKEQVQIVGVHHRTSPPVMHDEVLVVNDEDQAPDRQHTQ